MIDRVGQIWTNTRDLFLCVESHEEKLDVWKHTFVELDEGGSYVFEESETVDWKGKDLAYWKRVEL